jgi:hypothetical protein
VKKPLESLPQKVRLRHRHQVKRHLNSNHKHKLKHKLNLKHNQQDNRRMVTDSEQVSPYIAVKPKPIPVNKF